MNSRENGDCRKKEEIHPTCLELTPEQQHCGEVEGHAALLQKDAAQRKMMLGSVSLTRGNTDSAAHIFQSSTIPRLTFRLSMELK
jgi:hypothetical protein